MSLGLPFNRFHQFPYFVDFSYFSAYILSVRKQVLWACLPSPRFKHEEWSHTRKFPPLTVTVIWAAGVFWEPSQWSFSVNWGLPACLFSPYKANSFSAGLRQVWDKEKTEDLSSTGSPKHEGLSLVSLWILRIWDVCLDYMMKLNVLPNPNINNSVKWTPDLQLVKRRICH